MTWRIEETPEERIAELSAWLAERFQAPAGAPFLEPELMKWKYFTPRKHHDRARSYILTEDSRILAHVGVWPLRIQSATGMVDASHLIDWAADEAAPGAGAHLYMELARRSGTAIVMGGSSDAKRVLPKLKFLPTGEALVWARPVRPWRRWRRGAERDWRSIAKLCRNFSWMALPRPPAPDGWIAEPATLTGGELQHQPDAPGCVTRDTADLDYILRCPGNSTSLWRLRRNGDVLGYAVVALAGPQARIAVLKIQEDGDPASLAGAWSALSAAVSKDPAVHELTAMVSSAAVAAALAANGFRVRGTKPVFVFDASGRWHGVEWNLCGLDSDSFFLQSGTESYLT